MKLHYGETAAREVSGRIGGASTSTTTIKEIPASGRVDGMVIVDKTTGKLWVFDSDSSATASGDVLVPDAGSGRWLAASSNRGQMNIPLASFVDDDGDPLAKFADGASAVPGFNLADSEAYGIRWNNHATPNKILTQVTMPQDLDDAAAVEVHLLASKTGATLADAVTFVMTAFFITAGALHDADADAGGTTGAMTGDAAAKTVAELSLSIAAGDVPAPPCSIALTVKPTNGTLATDDVIIHAIWLEYTKKAISV